MTKKLTGYVMSYFLDFALVPGSETIFESVMFQDCIFTILSYEMTGDLAEIRLFCSCTILRLDVLGQETLLNLFLRNYLPYNLYDKAERLRSKAPRFEAHSNQQAVRIDDLELSNVQERFETFSVNMTHNLIVRLRHKQNLDKATADGHNVDGGLKAIGLTDQRETPSFEANPLDFLSTKLSYGWMLAPVPAAGTYIHNLSLSFLLCFLKSFVIKQILCS
ncbi:BnaA01g18610D [Brassica napus]|uniref:BnaA01g18610D protein n=1 Tax=Brassica napus TaxID=3708 RepID=A0A078GE59_BRANA|nr:BnaA01g18610D [Brassica napus]